MSKYIIEEIYCLNCNEQFSTLYNIENGCYDEVICEDCEKVYVVKKELYCSLEKFYDLNQNK